LAVVAHRGSSADAGEVLAMRTWLRR